MNNKLPSIRPLRCIFCFRRFKYETSRQEHMNFDHSDVLYHLQKYRDNENEHHKKNKPDSNIKPGIQIRIANSLYCEKLRKRSEFASLRFAENFRAFASLSLRNNYD